MGILNWFQDTWNSAFRDYSGLSNGAIPPDGISAYSSYGGGLSTAFEYGGGEKWDYAMGGSSHVVLDHVAARNNARTAYLDSVHAHALVNRFTDSVIDTGLKVKPIPNIEVLGITLEQAEEWARDVAQRFDLWAKSKKAHRAEQMTFYQTQRLAYTCQKRGGEYFARLYYDGDGINPLQLRLVDPNNIQGHAYTDTNGVVKIEDGIERDSRGRTVAYHVNEYNPSNGQYRQVRVPAKGRRSKLPLMLHGMKAEWAEQSRGYPEYLHLLQEFKELGDFTMSHIKKAIAQSTIALFNKPSEKAPASNPFADVEQNNPAGGMISDFYGNNSVANGASSTPAGGSVRYTPIKDSAFGTPGGVAVMTLDSGEELKPFANTAPAEGYDTFVKAFITSLASSVGMPPEILLMKFDQSYSAARGALMMFWRKANIERNDLASDLLSPTYKAWLALEVASGRITAPGWTDPVLREAWSDNVWSGIPMPNIDPAKTAKADQMYVEMGAQTIQDVAYALNGSNAEKNMGQLKREVEMLPTVPWSASAKMASEEEQDSEGQEDKKPKEQEKDEGGE